MATRKILFPIDSFPHHKYIFLEFFIEIFLKCKENRYCFIMNMNFPSFVKIFVLNLSVFIRNTLKTYICLQIGLFLFHQKSREIFSNILSSKLNHFSLFGKPFLLSILITISLCFKNSSLQLQIVIKRLFFYLIKNDNFLQIFRKNKPSFLKFCLESKPILGKNSIFPS